MAGTGKNVLAVLLIVTMFISLVGTIAAIIVMTSHGGYSQVPVATSAPNEDSGKVSAYLAPPPVEMTGRVTAYVVTSGEGGK
jgi:hypothetical protein